MTIDRDTKDWIRTAADERAARAGMRFDGERGEFTCNWIEKYCCLYEGERADQPLALYPAQREFLMRLFAWVRWSADWAAWIRRFTHAGFWAAKKNGKSPLAAAYNLYLLAGEGEPGQKVYMMANTGKQAKIAQLHAVMMVRQSPELSAEQGGDCKVNGTTLDIIHLPSSSRIEVVTGNDQRGADSKHGYNGSVTIDEMHVVTRPMMDAVGRAGISRREPLQTSFSTAGTDPSSVGFERCQYGRQVNAGDRDDPHFLHVEYAADEKASEGEIDERLGEFGRAANPAWGTLVKPDEFRSDWQRSKGNQRKVAIFLQERLNRWVGSVSRWLNVAGWEKGRRDYTRADLAGRECRAALDLSRTRDMTALVFVFPWPEEGPECVRIWPMFWLPRDSARERDHVFPFLSWAAAGHLSLTEGGEVDYGQVKADVRAAITGHGLKVLDLLYDPHYAAELTQALHEGERLGTAAVGGCVAKRTVFKQDLMHYTGPSKEYERRVGAGKILHPGNPVMSWQVGHCQVYRDRNQNIRPVKPDPHSGKSVDGVQCNVMALAGVVAAPYQTSFISSDPLVM